MEGGHDWYWLSDEARWCWLCGECSRVPNAVAVNEEDKPPSASLGKCERCKDDYQTALLLEHGDNWR